MVPWLVRQDGVVLAKYAIENDVRTPWKRLGRARYTTEMPKLSVVVDFVIQFRTNAKMDPRWMAGIFLGRREESYEAIHNTVKGAEHARTMKRRVPEERWNMEAFNTFIGVPWTPRGLDIEETQGVLSNRRRCVTISLFLEHDATDVVRPVRQGRPNQIRAQDKHLKDWILGSGDADRRRHEWLKKKKKKKKKKKTLGKNYIKKKKKNKQTQKKNKTKHVDNLSIIY
eukprot:NODE_13708_length_1151_cov_4.852539.p1 GENE.NODE_13708_length_1151_cov_4.852539~~NODE_13708_length_1151_cov_4.852539.p1  ORF type:complete len:227 (+),score=52.36 NODE_13708_length_1151_cov_4.852539:419-1099(+)